METGDERPQFTPRERDVLDELVRGRTNYEIAQRLGISLDGVKWHIREILSKLAVSSREEAAAYWSGQRGWRRGARRTIGLLFGLRTGVAVVGMLSIGTLLVGAWVLSDRADEGEPPGAADLPPLVAQSTPAPAEAVAPPAATPWGDGQNIPFTCDVSYAARRPTLAEIKANSPLWVRFLAADGRLFPALFGMSLSSVYYNDQPFANSAQIEPSSFFSSVPQPDASTRCTAKPSEHIITLRDYRPISLAATSSGAVLVVEPDPGTRHEVAFEPRTSPEPKGGASPASLPSLTVEDGSGRVITGWSVHAGQLSEGGRDGLVYARWPAGSPPQTNLSLGGEPQRLRFLSEGGGSGSRIRLAVLDGDGNVLSAVEVAGAAASWQQLALLDVPAGARTLQMSVVSGQVPGIFIVPAEAELPD